MLIYNPVYNKLYKNKVITEVKRMKVYISVDLGGSRSMKEWAETELGDHEHAWPTTAEETWTSVSCRNVRR